MKITTENIELTNNGTFTSEFTEIMKEEKDSVIITDSIDNKDSNDTHVKNKVVKIPNYNIFI